MGEDGLLRSLKEQLTNGYRFLFVNAWSGYMAGILIAVLALMIFLWNGMWGISGGYRNWGEWFYYLIGLGGDRPATPWMDPQSVTNLAILAGAMASALLSRQFKARRAPLREYGKGLIGGILMGLGAALAGGCNVGGFYSAIGVFSMGGYTMMIGLGLGAWLGLKVLLWEMENLPPATTTTGSDAESGWSVVWQRFQPVAGGILGILLIAAVYLYAAVDQARIGGLLIFGLLIGLVMHRSRFCFVRAFRDPFMTGEAEMVKVVSLSLMVYGFGSAVIKWNYIQPDTMGVYHPFWLGSLLGGTIFGLGMLLAGGCASSTLWRLAEGHTKLGVTLVTFALTNAAAMRFIEAYHIRHYLGKGLYLPGVFSWQLGLPLFMAVLLLWTLMAGWNEKTEKLVIF
ncbi:conserved membrane hypothetical protein [Desulfosarcina cetonica]|uniref:YeeE/YedE thiosulfate transporter family protein n=1 Tax=Desulfosarcina cetonica TaxID=90730 RepID=UPI0006D03353|nr:YeeE/YedE thiosulfate transporter family protein [Desulfosarcina cetonica]VTR67940.1 conserved membrane hypothetical protein [Desulfosarcina cetonica]